MSKEIYLIRNSPYNEHFLTEGYARSEDEIKQIVKKYRDGLLLETKTIKVLMKQGIVEVVDEDNLVWYYYILPMKPIVD